MELNDEKFCNYRSSIGNFFSSVDKRYSPKNEIIYKQDEVILG